MREEERGGEEDKVIICKGKKASICFVYLHSHFRFFYILLCNYSYNHPQCSYSPHLQNNCGLLMHIHLDLKGRECYQYSH